MDPKWTFRLLGERDKVQVRGVRFRNLPQAWHNEEITTRDSSREA